MLHAIHSVFSWPVATGRPDAKNPSSIKKMIKGDGCWDLTKEILDYLLEAIARTVWLPPDLQHPLAMLDQVLFNIGDSHLYMLF
jgi:hypothetical protein